MKNIALVVSLFCVLNSNAQITLEHVYDSAATWMAFSNQIIFVEFEDFERYIKIDKGNMIMTFYDVNHNYVSSLSLASFPNLSGYTDNFDIIYISDKLFNLDEKIEFIYFTPSSTSTYTGIYNEDGDLIFSVYDEAPWVIQNEIQQQLPIYNTSNGTKLILSAPYNKAKIYGLPGTLTTNIVKGNIPLLEEYYKLSAYPNPSVSNSTIEFCLPPGNDNGEIVIYDINGAEIYRYPINSNMNEIYINTIDLSSGTYYYQIQCPDGYKAGKKLMVVK